MHKCDSLHPPLSRLSDIQMPVMGGFEAAKRLRLHEMEHGIADANRQLIVGISANSDDTIEENALLSGMNCFMPVTTTSEYLFQIVYVSIVICE
jgi:CheY-like chemotaxis protein